MRRVYLGGGVVIRTVVSLEVCVGLVVRTHTNQLISHESSNYDARTKVPDDDGSNYVARTISPDDDETSLLFPSSK